VHRILIVEDSFSMRAFLRSALEAPGSGLGEIDVVEAASGFDALRLLPRGPYALVISDINMPHINGLELVRFIRQSDQHKGTRVLLISTQASDRDRERGMQLGADAYLAKPFTPEGLCEEARRQLSLADVRNGGADRGVLGDGSAGSDHG
jgi:two-component system, chemotaxis family, chemotaxis protein CheY